MFGKENNSTPVGTLMLNFLFHYGTAFDFRKVKINPMNPQYVNANHNIFPPNTRDSAMTIVDPTNISNNVTKGTTKIDSIKNMLIGCLAVANEDCECESHYKTTDLECLDASLLKKMMNFVTKFPKYDY